TFTVTIPRGVDGPLLTGVVADVLRDIEVQAKMYQGGRADLRGRVAKARAELLESEKDRFLTVGIVPDGTDAGRATFDVRLRQPHMNLFRKFDEGPVRVKINNRIVRSILFYDEAGELMRVSIDPPNHIINHNTGLPEADERQVGVDLMIESARFLTDYDVASESFGPNQSVNPDIGILFRGPPIPGVTTVGDLAQQGTRHISDKAILVNPHMVEAWDYLYAKRVRDLNQNQLALEVGRTRGHINKIVKGRDLPGDELFDAILEALQLDDEHRLIARQKLQVARDNRSPVPQSFIDLGKELRDLRQSANAVQYVRQHGRVNFKTEDEFAAAAGTSPAVIQSVSNGDVVPEDALFERIMKAFKLEGKYQDAARQRLARQRAEGLMTWKELTEKLQITEAYLSQLETGKMISARPLLRQMLTLYHPDQELLDRILILHKIAHMDVSIRNTGKTAINFHDFKSPERVALVRKVLDYYWQYDKTRKTPDQVTEQEIEWARYFRLSEWVYDQVHEFLQPLETNLDFNFSQLFLTELILNAIDSVHSKFGGAYGLGKLTVQVERKGETIVVHLGDNGTGVNAEWISEFGTREFSAAETGKEEAVLRYLGGSGIGLRQVYHDANERGIEVKAANLPTAAGAVFSVIIPEQLFMANGNGDDAVLGQTEVADIDGPSGVRTDQAVLSRERILTFLRGVPSLRFGFNQNISAQARLFANQLHRSKETQTVVFGVLPQPGNLVASEFDVLALTGQTGHSELF
ncbi:MAG: helix-turn-helix domain-containing protein, partial [Candidatus Omnitrophica bacterium]|nr:helix-turn-helix domain-containing protein [Candidatus Omnitrophota bacterium]